MRNSAIRVLNALQQSESIEARRSGSQSVDEAAVDGFFNDQMILHGVQIQEATERYTQRTIR